LLIAFARDGHEEVAMSPRIGLRSAGFALSHAILITSVLLPSQPLLAQDGAIRPGEAYVTRFSGTRPGQGGAPVIDPNGTVGSIIDVREPGKPPLGQHWIDEPQRKPVTAGQVGQVFGVTLDDASPPNVYLTATSAFGLHRAGANWMPGMWGEGGGPGAVYRLDASTGYAPRIFSQITLNGRPNSGAALGNIAYDRTNKQLFVSDLETGMIHRVRAADGGDLGFYDHGVQGRASFTNVVDEGKRTSLPPIAFDPSSRARLTDCPSRFDNNPQCWNLAASGRRVWGVGVRRDAVKKETRLYYAVWSSPAFGQTGWNQASDDEKRNSVWSVRLGPDGGFDPADVRRELILPDFFVKPQDIARAGYSQPVSDIAFAECGQRPVMLVAERGGIRNLGLAAQNPFANPHEARALRYELDEKGAWQAVGRYDVGFYDRSKDGAPFMRANCSGGIAFGLGYDTNSWVADQGKPDQFVWMTGDSLCSPEGPCNLGNTGQPAAGEDPQQASLQGGDTSEVHGIQGLAETAFEEVAPESAFANAPPTDETAAAAGPNQAYLIDTDINVDGSGNVIPQELVRNDATKIGDIAIYQMCEPPQSYTFMPAAPPSGHSDDVSHARLASHGRTTSHYRWGSHDPYWSHNRWGSHNSYWSHNRTGSHNRERSHWRYSSRPHDPVLSHRRSNSEPHDPVLSHRRSNSEPHDPVLSHRRSNSEPHDPVLSHRRSNSEPHDPVLSHRRSNSEPHDPVLSHRRTVSNPHSTRDSSVHDSGPSHRRNGSNPHSTFDSRGGMGGGGMGGGGGGMGGGGGGGMGGGGGGGMGGGGGGGGMGGGGDGGGGGMGGGGGGGGMGGGGGGGGGMGSGGGGMGGGGGGGMGGGGMGGAGIGKRP
jgi:hypothetical protein